MQFDEINHSLESMRLVGVSISMSKKVIWVVVVVVFFACLGNDLVMEIACWLVCRG